MNTFKRDFRFTAILGSLKIILRSKNSQKIMFDKNGTVSCLYRNKNDNYIFV